MSFIYNDKCLNRCKASKENAVAFDVPEGFCLRFICEYLSTKNCVTPECDCTICGHANCDYCTEFKKNQEFPGDPDAQVEVQRLRENEPSIYGD